MPTPRQTKQIRSSPGAAPSAALDSNPLAGSLLVVVTSYFAPNSDGSITVSDGVNTWVTVENQGVAIPRCAISYAENVAAGATTITVTSSGTGDQYITAFAAEFTGAKTSGAFDVDVGATGTSTSANSGTTATLAQTENLVVYVVGQNEGASIPLTVASTYTALDIERDNTTYQPISSGWKDVSTTSGQTVALTLDVSGTWVAAVAVFKDAAAGGGANKMLLLGVG